MNRLHLRKSYYGSPGFPFLFSNLNLLFRTVQLFFFTSAVMSPVPRTCYTIKKRERLDTHCCLGKWFEIRFKVWILNGLKLSSTATTLCTEVQIPLAEAVRSQLTLSTGDAEFGRKPS